jgi:hypothetical protein
MKKWDARDHTLRGWSPTHTRRTKSHTHTRTHTQTQTEMGASKCVFFKVRDGYEIRRKRGQREREGLAYKVAPLFTLTLYSSDPHILTSPPPPIVVEILLQKLILDVTSYSYSSQHRFRPNLKRFNSCCLKVFKMTMKRAVHQNNFLSKSQVVVM